MSPASRSVLAAAAGALLALAFHGLVWGGLEGFAARMDFNGALFEDFMGPYFEQGRALARGQDQPVPGFLYTPFFALLMEPLAALGPQVASWTWLGLLVASCLGLVVLGPLAAGRPQGPATIAAFTFAALCSVPLLHGLHWGQVSAPLTLLALGGALLASRGRPMLGGALLGVAGAIKLYPLVLLVLLLGPGRGPALGACAAAFVSCALVLPGLVLGPASTLEFYAKVAEALTLAQEGPWAGAPAAQAAPAVLARAAGLAAAPPWLTFACWGLGLALAAALGRSAWLGRPEGEPAPRAQAARLAALVAGLPLLVSPCWPHYLAWLPFAQGVALGRGRLGRGSAWLSAALASAVLFRLVDDHQRYYGAGLLLWASLVLLPGLLLPATRPAR